MIRDTELPRMSTRRAGEREEGRDSPRASAVNNKANRTASRRGSIGSKAGHMHRLRRAPSRVKASRSPPSPRTITAVTHTRAMFRRRCERMPLASTVAHAPGPPYRCRNRLHDKSILTPAERIFTRQAR